MRLVAGGLGRLDGVTLGYYAPLTMFGDVHGAMCIDQEEVLPPS